jgi:ABC-2 type transport system permease protein
MILAIVGIILLNVLSSFFFSRIDFTAEKRYTLSDITKTILKGLDDDV